MKSIRIALTWEGCLPMLLAAYEDGTPQDRAIALDELRRMAMVADASVERMRVEAEAKS